MIQYLRMKKSYIILFLLFSIGVVYFATPYQYWIAKLYSFTRPDSEYTTTYYAGTVNIETTTFDKMTGALRAKKCNIKMDATNSALCNYWRKQHPIAGDSLLVDPTGQIMAPFSFTVTKDKLFFSKSIPGKPNIALLKDRVRKDASFVGVQILENSWRLDSVKYPWDAIF